MVPLLRCTQRPNCFVRLPSTSAFPVLESVLMAPQLLRPVAQSAATSLLRRVLPGDASEQLKAESRNLLSQLYQRHLNAVQSASQAVIAEDEDLRDTVEQLVMSLAVVGVFLLLCIGHSDTNHLQPLSSVAVDSDITASLVGSADADATIRTKSIRDLISRLADGDVSESERVRLSLRALHLRINLAVRLQSPLLFCCVSKIPQPPSCKRFTPLPPMSQPRPSYLLGPNLPLTWTRSSESCMMLARSHRATSSALTSPSFSPTSSQPQHNPPTMTGKERKTRSPKRLASSHATCSWTSSFLSSYTRSRAPRPRTQFGKSWRHRKATPRNRHCSNYSEGVSRKRDGPKRRATLAARTSSTQSSCRRSMSP